MTDVQTRADVETTSAGEQTAGPRLAGSRRVVLAGAGALGAGCLLAACGTDTSGSSSSTGANGGDFSDNPKPAGSATAPAGDAADSSSGTVLAAVSDVPEGGGIIKGDYVITQPEAGTFKAFSKICTHQGCPVTKIDGTNIFCPCHNSTFDISDGSPTGGPATKALPETKVKKDGDNIVAA
ncbi:Rieske (2Fe-2S) protein [Symbioplanes lichenis]|uniref:Rieske (2Fe-2S) protein n=1 Tax=Symbioplanes lichenis TaxID=1629072 RepID=UPI00273A2CDB|nr:Rieske (2Fe-2S) protein [Actinoplanes lichenis]